MARMSLVQRLQAVSGSLPNFMRELIRAQARVAVGTEAAAFMIEALQEGAFSLKPIAHVREDNSDADTRQAAMEAFEKIVRNCVEQNKEGAIHIEGTWDGSESQYCLVNLLRSENQAVAASAVITRARDLDRARKLLELIAIVGGMFELFTLRRKDEQSRAIAQSHQHVLQLATAVGTGEGFQASAMNLCNELSTRTGATRVSLGWVKGETIKLKAMSHTEEFDKKQELAVQLVRVMEECLDNDEIVQFEPGGTASNTVTREAQTLSRMQGNETILSLPLRRNGETVGVITLEFSPNSRIGAQAATGLAVGVDLLAPQLYDRFQNDRNIATKVGLSVVDLGEKAVGKKHWLTKIIIIAVILVLAFITFYKPMYRVKATFSFVPIEKRSFGAPFDNALLRKVHVKPGDKVKAGDVLLEFDADDAKLARSKAMEEANAEAQQALQYQADSSKTSEMLQARARERAARAQVSLYDIQIAHANIVAPFDGQVLTGELHDKEGSLFRQGEPLIEFASLQDANGKLNLEAQIAVNERDIQDVHEGKMGSIATAAEPLDRRPVQVTRVVPEGVARDASNEFTVYADLQSSNEQWRPGMLGEARIDVEPRSLLWQWTHRFVDFVRMKLWI